MEQKPCSWKTTQVLHISEFVSVRGRSSRIVSGYEIIKVQTKTTKTTTLTHNIQNIDSWIVIVLMVRVGSNRNNNNSGHFTDLAVCYHRIWNPMNFSITKCEMSVLLLSSYKYTPSYPLKFPIK